MREIIKVPIGKLVPADWNYKTDGTEEQITKLMKSIAEDQSAGVPAVRLLPDGTYEVIDGNHRLKAIKRLKWKTVQVENFGDIKKSTAILISRRRNHQWFEDDLMKFAALLRDEVLPDISIEDMAEFMPDSPEELLALSNLLDFDWSQFEKYKNTGPEGVEHECPMCGVKHHGIIEPETTEGENQEVVHRNPTSRPRKRRVAVLAPPTE